VCTDSCGIECLDTSVCTIQCAGDATPRTFTDSATCP
jgi:hypothetical protein